MKNKQKQLRIKETSDKQNKETRMSNYNDGKNLPHKVIFEELVTERIDEIIALTNKINFEDLIHYLKRNITTKTFENFENGIKLFSKIKMW